MSQLLIRGSVCRSLSEGGGRLLNGQNLVGEFGWIRHQLRLVQLGQRPSTVWGCKTALHAWRLDRKSQTHCQGQLWMWHPEPGRKPRLDCSVVQ